MVARFEHVTRAVHVGYLKGWTRTVPPFHAHTYTRPLPCSTLHPGSLVSQLVSASHHRENRREFEVFNSREIVDTPPHRYSAVRDVKMGRLSEMMVPWSPMETRLDRVTPLETPSTIPAKFMRATVQLSGWKCT